jgi:hypothetical protein
MKKIYMLFCNFAIFQQIGAQTIGFTCAISLELLLKMNALTSNSVAPPGDATLASARTQAMS